MESIKRIIKKIFCLPPLPTVLIAVPSFVFVFVMLGLQEHGVLAYIAYGLSAYAMVIFITGTTKIIRTVRQGIGELKVVKKIRANPVGERLLGDDTFRAEISLRGGLGMNFLYAALNLFSGIRYHSTWFAALSAYYALLCVMRILLITQVRRAPAGQDIPAEFRRYRSCGIALLFMNQALVGIVIYIVKQNKGFFYPGILLYAMATYTFYITITAMINVVKYRKRGSPVLSAAKVINLTAALVSMLSLETAMLAQFGADEPAFRQIMTAASGGGVCVIVLGMAIFMIVRSTKELNRFSSF